MNKIKSGALLAFQKLVLGGTITAAPVLIVVGMDPKKNISEISSSFAN